MRYKANFPQISENFIKYTMKTKIYKYKLKFGYICTEILFSVEISNQSSIRFHFLIVIKWVFSYKACIMSEAVVLGRGNVEGLYS
jgi:hypothetical protein